MSAFASVFRAQTGRINLIFTSDLMGSTETSISETTITSSYTTTATTTITGTKYTVTFLTVGGCIKWCKIKRISYKFSTGCEDKWKGGGCNRWAGEGDCTDPTFQRWMENNCAKACGHCSGTSETSTFGTATAEEPQCGGLMDYFGACPEWAADGDCNDTILGWEKFMMKLCSFSCCSFSSNE